MKRFLVLLLIPVLLVPCCALAEEKFMTHEAAMISVAGKLPATIFNAAVAILFAPILAVAIRKALDKNHMTLN